MAPRSTRTSWGGLAALGLVCAVLAHSVSAAHPSRVDSSRTAPTHAPAPGWLSVGDQLLSVQVNTQTGAYGIVLDGQTYMNASTAAYAYRNNSAMLSVGAGSIKLDQWRRYPGQDTLGPFEAVALTWNNGAYQTEFRAYDVLAAVVFEARYLSGLVSCANGSNTDVVTAFPTLGATASAIDTSLNYLTYKNTFASPHMGFWKAPDFPGGAKGGVPIVWYDSSLRTVVMSPLDNFMVGVQTMSHQLGGVLAAGLQGRIASVPAGFSHSTLLFAGQGVNQTLYDWGGVLLKWGSKPRTSLSADRAIQHLGYWTDNGAYYYYNTEPTKNYEVTMQDVRHAANSSGVPFQYFQFDSWWYYKNASGAEHTGGVYLWEPMPSIFPDTMGDWFDHEPLALHNRYFSPTNAYLADYVFIVEPGSIAALPLDPRMFLHIMGKAKAWGMFMYEQDWLVTTMMSMNATQNNVTNAKNWLLAMGSAATQLGVSIQYCMPLPNFLLQSTAIPSVTNVRASGDYHPGGDQWNIGITSQLLWSLGVLPFKDDFWTTPVQPGNPYGPDTVEPNTVLEALVAALSAGPVGPSDSIGHFNKDLIMRTCRDQGMLLKPDKPATPLDAAFSAGFATATLPQVWDTYSTFSSRRWHYVLATELVAPFTLTTADLGAYASGASYLAFNGLNDTQRVKFDAQTPLTLRTPAAAPGGGAPTPVPFSYTVVAPVLPNGWVLAGETSKFVWLSRQRFVTVQADASSIFASIAGDPGEKVDLLAVNAAGHGVRVVCNVGDTGTAIMACDTAASAGCSCQ